MTCVNDTLTRIGNCHGSEFDRSRKARNNTAMHKTGNPHEYTSQIHRHRFASWCAASAANKSRNCRFKIEQGVILIEESGLCVLSNGWNTLPQATDFDSWHRINREKLVTAALKIIDNGRNHVFSHGVAAKLINCYLKALFIAGIGDTLSPENRQKCDAIYPPIDRLLLGSLAIKNVGGFGTQWKGYEKKGWSNFSCDDYEAVIDLVKKTTNGELWKIEYYWRGFR